MDALIQFIALHGYAVIAGWVFLDQLGVPVPAIPILVVAGAISGTGELHLGATLAAATVGAIPSDVLWYETGRRRGSSVLRTICRLTLEPDSCVRRTEDTFARYGPRSLLMAKFVPGYQTLAPALAGLTGVPLHRFLLYDVPGAMLWSAAFIGAGWVFRDQVGWAVEKATGLGGQLGIVLAVALAAWIAWKWVHRQWFLRSLRGARIAPSDLKDRMDAGQPLAIVDLRSELSIRLQPERVPGAQVMSVEEIDARHDEIPRGVEVVLYCT